MYTALTYIYKEYHHFHFHDEIYGSHAHSNTSGSISLLGHSGKCCLAEAVYERSTISSFMICSHLYILSWLGSCAAQVI